MAILEELPGVEVTITVNDEALQEYVNADLVQESKTVARFVEAQSKQVFAVKVVTQQAATRGADFEYRIRVDGAYTDSLHVSYERVKSDDHTWTNEGMRIGDGRYYSYNFGNLNVESEVTINRGEPNHKLEDLGTIEVDVYHVLSTYAAPRPISNAPVEAPKPLEHVSESEVKGRALSHVVEYGGEIGERRQGSDGWVVDVEYLVAEPIATFRFHYCSKEALKAERIIPRTPSPEPLEDRESLTPDEVRELQKQLKASKGAMAAQLNIKRENRDEDLRPRKRARPSADAEIIELD